MEPFVRIRTLLTSAASLLIVACNDGQAPDQPQTADLTNGKHDTKPGDDDKKKKTDDTHPDPTSDDGKKSGDETDVDCGGSSDTRCGDGKSCNGGSDCSNAVCTRRTCQAPSPTDRLNNDEEHDVRLRRQKAPK